MESTFEQPEPHTVLAAALAPRMVTVLLSGTEILIPCPDWCIASHEGEELLDLGDLAHTGAPVSMNAPAFVGTEPVLVAYLRSWPFAETPQERRPYVAFEAKDDGEVANLPSRARVESVARRLEEHAAQMRAMAGVL